MILSNLNFENELRTVILVILEAGNLERMRQGDPVTLESIVRGGILTIPKYPANTSIVIAYEEDEVELYRLSRAGDILGLLRYVERGRRWIEAEDGKKNAISLHRVDERRAP